MLEINVTLESESVTCNVVSDIDKQFISNNNKQLLYRAIEKNKGSDS